MHFQRNQRDGADVEVAGKSRERILRDIDHEPGEQEITQDGKENDERRDEIENPAALQDGLPFPLRQRIEHLAAPDSDPDNETQGNMICNTKYTVTRVSTGPSSQSGPCM